MMPVFCWPIMATTKESKSDSTPSTTSSSYNTYNKSVAVSAAASIRNPSVLVSWILEHKSRPYPTKEEKMVLAEQAGMTITQVSYWFANTRRRIKKLGSWIVWEESQVHHKTPVVIHVPHLSPFPCSDPFSTTNNILTADYSKPNPSGSLYHPGYPYPYPGSLCGPAGIHGFRNAPSGIWNVSTSSSPALMLNPPQLESATFTLPPKSADACMPSPLVPHTPSYSPSFQPFTNSTCITPTSITPMLPPSAITSNSSYKSPHYGPTTGTLDILMEQLPSYIPLGPPPAVST